MLPNPTADPQLLTVLANETPGSCQTRARPADPELLAHFHSPMPWSATQGIG